MSDEPQIIEPDDNGADDFYEAPRLGTLVQFYRDKAGLTQADLFTGYRLDQSMISEIESGHTRRPQNDTLRRIAMAFSEHLNVPADRIYNNLIEAREQKPMAPGYDPEATVIFDLLSRLPRWARRIAWHMMETIVDDLTKLLGHRGAPHR